MVPAVGARALVLSGRVAVGPFLGRQILLRLGFVLRRGCLSDAFAARTHAQDLSDGLRLQGFVSLESLPLLRLLERVLASYYDPC